VDESLDLPLPENKIRFPYISVTKLEVNNPETFVWEDMIARGRMTVLHSPPKLGKTTLVSQMLAAINRGEQFLRRATSRGPVFVCSEEAPGQWLDRAEELGLDDTIYVHCRPEILPGDWAGWSQLVIDTLFQAKDLDVQMVILDTINDFWPVENELDNPAIGKALRMLNPLLEHGIAVLVVAHSRKGGGDEVAALRGGSAFAGKADMVLQLGTITDDDTSLTRKLTCRGRFPNYPRRIDMEMGLEGYTVHVAQEDRRIALRREAILKSIPAGEENAVSGRQLQEMSNTRSRKVFQARIRELESHPKVHSKSGPSGSTFWWTSEDLGGPE